MTFVHTTTGCKTRAETAVADAPILPPAPQAATSQLNKLFGVAAVPQSRIAGRRNRLRTSHRPAARTWRRRAARCVHSLFNQRGDRGRD